MEPPREARQSPLVWKTDLFGKLGSYSSYILEILYNYFSFSLAQLRSCTRDHFQTFHWAWPSQGDQSLLHAPARCTSVGLVEICLCRSFCWKGASSKLQFNRWRVTESGLQSLQWVYIQSWKGMKGMCWRARFLLPLSHRTKHICLQELW